MSQLSRALLKSYAPKARTAFLAAVTDRAKKLGLLSTGNEPLTVSGDLAFIAGQPFPRSLAALRAALEKKIARDGYTVVIEAAAYTWFNRFMAIRYMELHGYLDHGFRVLSHPQGKSEPELLEQAAGVELPGLDKARVLELKLDGTKDGELYKMLLLAQCHALHKAMPFLFEPIDDATELLLPDNLLAPDSVIRTMVSEIPEDDWQEIEIIGWLYQFYISEKKDQVIGKVVKSEDIPAATQLFTPNWIVKYMVQNSLGRQWVATYPSSPLKGKMEYYIEPAEQTPEVQAQLDAITPKALDPEALTLIDPACGSGHILVEAYDLFKEIYLERGYRLREIPQLILTKNLYGLDIDDRAAQMAGFALLMKARADDRRLLDDTPPLNVRALQSSTGLNAQDLADALDTTGKRLSETPSLAGGVAVSAAGEVETRRQPTLALDEPKKVGLKDDLQALLDLFVDAKTIGSLLTIPDALAKKLPSLRALLEANREGNLLAQSAVNDLEPLVAQAEILGRQYDAVVANPPYMGSKGMNADLKLFAGSRYPRSKADLFAMFIERGLAFARENGFSTMITMQSWMFLSSYEIFRKFLLERKVITDMAQLGPRAFSEISGEVVQTTAFVTRNLQCLDYQGTYIRAIDGNEEEKALTIRIRREFYKNIKQRDLEKIPGSPVAYWVSEKIRDIFYTLPKLGDVADTKQGLATTNNSLFLRNWFEIDISKVGFGFENSESAKNSNKKWFPINKGGGFRKWYGNNNFVINFENDGKNVCDYIDNTPGVNVKSNGRVINRNYYFKEGLTWSSLASGIFSMRYSPNGFIFETKGAMCFPKKNDDLIGILALMNSKMINNFLNCISPTLDYHEGPLKLIPVRIYSDSLLEGVNRAVKISKNDWDSFEISWDFQRLPLLNNSPSLSEAFTAWESHCLAQRARMKELEEENNRLFIAAYGLQDELTPDVPDEQVTLAKPDRDADMRRLVSYALGCMMGRYSLDAPGLIYAHSGGEGFDPTRYTSFPADDDGILPLTDTDWFGDSDTASRIEQFVKVVWPHSSTEGNLKFLADSLSPKTGETPLDTLRRYLHTGFYKDHCQTYKKRPIYWLFTSGKERAFQALVYLHRYNAGTLARMRMEYVIPLQGRLSARLDALKADIEAASSTASRKKLQNEQDKLRKQQDELRRFDEKLRHLADQRIALDLDDGVKVNYGKFGELLSDVKAITGGAEE
jgi:type II restriction/modification system DNA methylase subunit YeeA